MPEGGKGKKAIFFLEVRGGIEHTGREALLQLVCLGDIAQDKSVQESLAAHLELHCLSLGVALDAGRWKHGSG